ncbi:unnamed protein product, partial [Diamesa serratosioi]
LPTDEKLLPTLSNGHLGFTLFSDSIYMNGLYNGKGGLSHRARIPNWSNIQLANCASNINNTQNCNFTLNTKSGYFMVEYYVADQFKVIHLIYAHRFYNRAIINQFFIQRLQSKEAENIHQKTNNANANDDIEFIENKTIHLFDMEFQLLCGHTIELEMENQKYQSNRDQQERRTEEEPTAKEHHDNEKEEELKEVCVLWNTVPDEITLQQQALTVSYKFVMTLDKKYHLAKQEMMDVFTITDSDLMQRNIKEWKEFWHNFHVDVVGDDDLAKAIHSSIFYLTSNLPSSNTNQPQHPFYGLSPTGLGRGGRHLNDYEGHNFWDTELFMLPPVSLINPLWAKQLLHYRFMMMNSAKENAHSTGYRGARYPWESAATGHEVIQPCCPNIAKYEQHVTGDVSFALRYFLSLSHDFNWLLLEGCQLATEIAQFWESRVHFNDTSKFYDINGIMGPDEDHENIDNNVYTNVIAGYSLYFGSFIECLCQKNISEEEQKDFVKIARSLKLLYNETADFHPEYEEYEIGEPIKQADVVLLGFPLQFPMDPKTKRNNLLTYEKVTRENGPAMTWAMHTIGFLDLNDEKEAAINFERSFNIYTREPFKVWSEVIPGTVGAGNFITGAGGFLQSIINGYGGVRLHFDHLIITNFYLPPKTTTLDFAGITYLNNRFSMKITGEDATINFIDLDPTHPLEIMIGSKIIEVLKSTTINFKRSDELIMKPKINPFGTCVMKETVTGLKAGVSRISLNSYIVIILASIAVIANFIGIL